MPYNPYNLRAPQQVSPGRVSPRQPVQYPGAGQAGTGWGGQISAQPTGAPTRGIPTPFPSAPPAGLQRQQPGMMTSGGAPGWNGYGGAPPIGVQNQAGAGWQASVQPTQAPQQIGAQMQQQQMMEQQRLRQMLARQQAMMQQAQQAQQMQTQPIASPFEQTNPWQATVPRNFNQGNMYNQFQRRW